MTDKSKNKNITFQFTRQHHFTPACAGFITTLKKSIYIKIII